MNGEGGTGAPSGGEFSIPVVLGRDIWNYKEGHTLPLVDKGRVTVSADAVVVEGKEVRTLRFPRPASLRFSPSQIGDVAVDGRDVWFAVYPPGEALADPLHVCVAVAPSAEDAGRLAEALASGARAPAPDAAGEGACPPGEIPVLQPIRAPQRVEPFLPLFTYALIGACALVFAAMVATGVDLIQPKTESLLRWGADHGPRAASGEWWRTFTSMFVHVGLIHIGLNMWVLSQCGPFLERLFGRAFFLPIYLACGLVGSLASLAVHPEVVSAGASGAIFGLYGALLGYLGRERRSLPREAVSGLLKNGLWFVGINLFLGFSIPAIDNAAHIGGLLAGCVLGFLGARPLKPAARRAAGPGRSAAVAIAILLLLGGGAFFLSRSSGMAYSRFLETVEREEDRANASFRDILPLLQVPGSNREGVANRIEAECANRWRTVVEEGRAIPPPRSAESRRRYGFLMRVAELNVKRYRCLADGIRRDDPDKFREAMDLLKEIQEQFRAYKKE
ncbi:MAG: rhomboid family intramembrane serine protease [Planctomycetota bacterium]